MESEERNAGDSAPPTPGGGSPNNVASVLRSRPPTTIPTSEDLHQPSKVREETLSNPTICCGGINWADVYYIATWGIFGAIVRVYIGRILGGDCEVDDTGDFWKAANICITASGVTSRRGGALFLDLPANILGSFFMGLLSESADHPLPWFGANHYVQRHSRFHKGLTTGFCGCLTTCTYLIVIGTRSWVLHTL